jgi:hypothetical protein
MNSKLAGMMGIKCWAIICWHVKFSMGIGHKDVYLWMCESFCIQGINKYRYGRENTGNSRLRDFVLRDFAVTRLENLRHFSNLHDNSGFDTIRDRRSMVAVIEFTR